MDNITLGQYYKDKSYFDGVSMIRLVYNGGYWDYTHWKASGQNLFFFDKDYSTDLQNVPNGKELMKMIDKVRGPIRSMDSTNKAHCADYVLKLSKLSEMYNSM